ncbi:MAG: hypothetical protein HMLKMBBP_01360 [Planctomycetes bacterium]|nr:hypothetical protein [Planctomycetota bacterium]
MMEVEIVSTADQSLIRAVRATLGDAEDAFLCVAFVHDAGVRLLQRELLALRQRKARIRLLATTTFGATSTSALALARELGAEVRILNPGGGQSYHPKIYLGAQGGSTQAVIGSANLTGGLFTNVEVAVRMRGARKDLPLASAWSWAEDRWADCRAEPWVAEAIAERTEDVLEPELEALIERERQRDPEFQTLGPTPRTNRIVAVGPSAVLVETDRSRRASGGPAVVPAWMFNLAWQRLRTHGTLTNVELLEGLRVHRSSAVCAILGRLPGVVVRAAPITLVWQRRVDGPPNAGAAVVPCAAVPSSDASAPGSSTLAAGLDRPATASGRRASRTP